MNLNENPHRRYNPLSGDWIKVSPHRTQRPWNGQREQTAGEVLPAHDPECYLCPGNTRAGGHRNPEYTHTYVFDNDYASLLPGEVSGSPQWSAGGGLLQARAERGICRVLCFSPRHDLTLSRMNSHEIGRVIQLWDEQYQQLGGVDFINHVQIFENRGAVMGCSNPHPHGQVWAEELIPDLPARELAGQAGYLKEKKSCLLCDYLEQERTLGDRIVIENSHFTVLVPFWATWPYETLVLPRNHHAGLSTLSPEEKNSLGEVLIALGIRYDNLFETSFPYSMGIHQAPTDGKEHPEVHFHFHYFPPLLRSASVKKFMVGYELLAMAQRDITAELSAQRLRELSEVHYLDREQERL